MWSTDLHLLPHRPHPLQLLTIQTLGLMLPALSPTLGQTQWAGHLGREAGHSQVSY